jgi:hypothetical protein
MFSESPKPQTQIGVEVLRVGLAETHELGEIARTHLEVESGEVLVKCFITVHRGG